MNAMQEIVNGSGAVAPFADAEPSPVAAYLGSLQGGERSIRATRYALARAAKVLGLDIEAVPWASLRFQHVAAIRTALAEQCVPSTANASLSAVKGVLKAAWKLGQMTGEDYARIVDEKGVTGSRLPAGRALAGDEVAKLLDACEGDGDKPVIALRDKAMIALLAGAGLRRAEAVSAQIEDYDGERLTVIGKGNKERRAALLGDCRGLVDAWLRVRGDAPGALLRRVSQTGDIDHAGAMKDSTVMSRLMLLSKRAGIEHVRPHDLRRTYITALLDGGTDLLTVQRVAGHARPETTARYDRRPDQAAAEAAQKVSLLR